jgi:hypothetical protein
LKRLVATGTVAALLAVVLAWPITADASFGIAPGDPNFSVLDADGNPYAVAGGHPDRVEASFGFNTVKGEVEGNEEDLADGNPKDVLIEFPPGFAGNPQAVVACPRSVFQGQAAETGEACPPESQVGVATIVVHGAGGSSREFEPALYNVQPAPGELGQLGFSLLGTTVLWLRLRSDDYGLTIEQRDLAQALTTKIASVELWGVPADHQEGGASPRRPFLTLPTRCDRGPLSLTVRARSWQEPDRWVSARGDTGIDPTGCDSVPFAPQVSFDLSTSNADSPSGASVDFTVPQDSSVEGRASSAIKQLNLELPNGLTISPGVVSGLELCTDSELGLASQQPARCPDSSRVGTVELASSQLGKAVDGGLYLGQPLPGERFRLFMIAEGPGIVAKFVGALHINPSTGRIETTLTQLPEISFERLSLRFNGGERALMATPLSCGQLTAVATVQPYGSTASAHLSDAATVDRSAQGGPCPASPPFSPSFTGGATSSRPGRSAGLSLTLSRQSGEQLPDRFSVVLPRGLSAGIGSVGRCGGAALATAACPPASRVGSVVGEVGSGTSTASLAGDAYLTGPYRRAPFGMVLVLRAALGPFDFGTIVTRAALRVSSSDGRVTVDSDSLPRTLEGIPIRFRTIGLDIDRPGFINTPTSCAPAAIDTTVWSATGAAAGLTTPFAVRGCNRLSFTPQLSMRFAGRDQMRQGGSPSLLIAIKGGRKGTNLRKADIALPASLAPDLAGVHSICARQDAIDQRCPSSSRVGRARAVTPLTADPLLGPIHVVQPEGSGPPELWTSIDSDGLSFNIRTSLSVRRGRMHTRIAGLPDITLSTFAMRLGGRDDGFLSFKRDPCGSSDRHWAATAELEGQNQAYRIERKLIARPGCRESLRGQ